MALISKPTDYTDKDFDSILLRLQNLVRSAFPEWTDFSVANFGNILLQLFSFVADIVLYYADASARESRLTTATQRKSLLALAKLIGYRPAGSQAATATETFTLAAPPVGNVTIPAGYVVRTQDVANPLSFQVLTPVIIAAASDPPEANGTVEHSEGETELFEATGLPYQEVVLPFTPYLDGSAEVTASNGVYTEVDNFLNSTAAHRHFVVIVNQNDKATIRFGTGVNGALPQGTITVEYKTGGGSVGNVEAGTLTKSDGGLTDQFGNPVQLFVTNADRASGGADRETISQIRQNAPASLRTLTRSVTKEDFETNARRVAGVARALMLTSDQDAGVAENTGLLYVVPVGGGAPSQALKDAVLTMVTETYPHTLTFQVEVRDPLYVTVNLSAIVYLRKGTTAATVRAAILAALRSLFAISQADGTPNPSIGFGADFLDALGQPAGEVVWSDVFDAIRDATGVRKVDEGPEGLLLNGERASLSLNTRQFPVLGTVSLVNGDTGTSL